MYLLYINNREIKLLSYKKYLFKQIEIDFFSKTYSTPLLKEGKIYNVDILASAVKEATSAVFKNQKTSKVVLFILPSPPFEIKRISLPLDVHEQAVKSFVAQKLLSLYPYKDFDFFFTLHTKEKQKLAIAYLLEKEILEALTEVTKILELEFKGIIPESLALFRLFEKTLSKSKTENTWYIHADKNDLLHAKGYFYDNFGPLEEEQMEFETKDFEEFKEKIIKEKEKRKEKQFGRLILSGNLSSTIRQDTLTKDLEIWVNPLYKIIEKLYQPQVKKIPNQDPRIFLKYDAHFSLLVYPNTPTLSTYKTNFNFTEKKKTISPLKPLILPFLIPFLIVFSIAGGIFWTRENNLLPLAKKAVITPSPTPSPSSTPTPTPVIKKEEIKLKILNGSGIKGQAARLSTFLKEKGYKDIVVDNADNFDYSTTIIRVKDKKYLPIILEDLKEVIEKPKTELLENKGLPEDITVIIGKDLQV